MTLRMWIRNVSHILTMYMFWLVSKIFAMICQNVCLRSWSPWKHFLMARSQRAHHQACVNNMATARCIWRREWQTTSVFLPWESHEQHEKAKRYDTERWTPRSVVPLYAPGEERINYRKNEDMEPKQKQCPIVLWLVMEVKSSAVKNKIA